MPVFYIFDNDEAPNINSITPHFIYNDIKAGEQAVRIMANFFEYRIYKVERDHVAEGRALKLNPTDTVAFVGIRDQGEPVFRTIKKIADKLKTKIEEELPELETNEDTSYAEQLQQFFSNNSPVFFEQSLTEQWDKIKTFTRNPAFIALMQSHWSFSSVFLKSIAEEAKVQKDLLKHDHFGPIIYLNELRKSLISKAERKNLTITQQQHIILRLLGTDAQGKIKIPKDLFDKNGKIDKDDEDWDEFKKECDEKYGRIKSQVTASASQAPVWNNNNNNNNANQVLFTDERISKLYALFSLRQDRAPEEQKSYIERLSRVLSAEFFSKTPADRWNEIYALRTTSEDFLKVLMSHWQLSCLFLEKISQAVGDSAKAELSNSRLSRIFALNNLRRVIIPDAEVRTRTSMATQQALVLNALASLHQNAGPQQNLVAMPVDHVRTVNINQRIDDGEINIPDTHNLTCPITRELLKNPVKVGIHYFTKEALINSVISTNGFNPLTRAPLTREQVERLPIDKDKEREVENFKNQYTQPAVSSSSSRLK